MGEVYRAKDITLKRDVALKVLPVDVSTDRDRLARFRREAEVLASLNHPHIAQIYGVEHTADTFALVMELVEGEDLAQRIARGPIALDEVLSIARQTAEALEAAHDHGIIHRDLKPANIKVRPDATVKVLDFGLAKTIEAVSGSSMTALNLPTVSAHATQPGIILGTAAYMSPEQARGHTVDKRTDIWAFGCLLYELLTGRRAFPGQSSADTLAAIVSAEADWRLLPEATPDAIRTLLQRTLEKDPRQRLRDIGDARIELDAAIASRRQSPAERRAEGATPARPVRTWLRRLAFAAAVVSVVAVTFVATIWLRPRAEAPAETVRMTALLPPGVSMTRGPGMLLSLALSPDGRTLIIAGTDSTGQRLYRRTLDRLDATPVPGTEGGLVPFFSPDGAWIGFFADRRLKRVPAGGGAAVDITAAPGFPAGASWGINNRIVFASGSRSPLRIVDAGGGAAESLTTLDAGLGHLFPEMLPDGRTVLFNEGGWIHALDLGSGHRTNRLVQGIGARYAPSGHLILSRQTTLLAIPFDAARLEITGQAIPLVEDVAVERGSGGGAYMAVSPSGTLAYVAAALTYALVLVEPDGTERTLSEDPLLENPRFSPDGQRLVVARTRRAGELPELWVYDLKSVAPAFRLTSEGARAPVWTPDGASVTYSRLGPSEQSGIYTRSADGRGDARQVVRLPNFHWLVGWTPGRTLAYGSVENVAADGLTRSSIVALTDGKSRRVVGPGDTWGGRLSPDGQRLVYYSLESGYFEIYVTPFPDTKTRWLIAEGTDPSWSPDGSEIYYRFGSRLMAARIDTASGVRVQSRRVVVEPFSPPLYDDYDIHPNRRTVALVRALGDVQGREITLVFNWLTELQRLMKR
jgi:eukaryotic-like serine/threonine-protein kinase